MSHVDLRAIYEEMAKGYVVSRLHPECDFLSIYNYTNHTTYDHRWNDTTMMCRGLILDNRTGEIIARPMDKFFNYGENLLLEKEIPWEEKPEVTVKQDGSLGISYKIDGELYWASRGSFDSEQARMANKIWQENYKDAVVFDGITLMVEIIYPENKIVVDYDDMTDLILIAARDIETGREYDYLELRALAMSIGMLVTERKFASIQNMLKWREDIPKDQEGWVLKWSSGHRLKIKGKKYLEIHRAMFGISNRQLAQAWYENRTDDIFKDIPEEVRPELERKIEILNKEMQGIVCFIVDAVGGRHPSCNSRKEFARYVSLVIDKKWHGLIFKYYDSKLTDDDVKYYVWKNYRDYL